MKTVLHDIRAPDQNVRVEHRLEEGEPANVILKVARESDAGLIVMGTHGRTELERLVLGSVAEQVVRAAPCAVLTVKPGPNGGGNENQAVPICEHQMR